MVRHSRTETFGTKAWRAEMSFMRVTKSTRSTEVCAFLMSSRFVLRQAARNFPSSRYGTGSRARFLCAQAADTKPVDGLSVAKEMEQARREARPYNIDKSKLTPAEREKLRLKSKSIPLVADKEPLEIVFEDDRFLVVNKPSFLKMHPSHRFEGGSLLNRAIGYCGYTPWLLHRLDMVGYRLNATTSSSASNSRVLSRELTTPLSILHSCLHLI